MNTSEPHIAQHEIVVAAPALAVFQLLVDVQQWPRIFPPTVFVDHLGRDGRSERIRIWATANGEVKTWVSRRELDPVNLRIDFRQEVSATPIASMGGTWLVDTLADGRARVRLWHHYEADAPENLAWIEETVDRNSRAELNALRTHLETTRPGELTFSFEDTVHIDGTARDVFAFLDDADRWPQRLPHVARARLDRAPNGVQSLEMDTRSPHGTTHTTRSYRVAFPHHGIAYKQVTLPPLLSVHTGYWTVAQHGRRLAVSSRHSVVLDPGNITSVLGADASMFEARKYVREALSANSLTTLEHAKRYAEQAGH
ncbi:aromatase/cyclase [Streptomyces rimosus]|uniref:aromatase/cyclase n=1 Tax=Streptomyces rimosus TaxID=1927 RepID=UPI0031E05ADD